MEGDFIHIYFEALSKADAFIYSGGDDLQTSLSQTKVVIAHKQVVRFNFPANESVFLVITPT